MSVPSTPVALAVGDTLPVRTIGPLTRTDIVRYAGAGGDLNPIHHDDGLAQAAGFPTVFAMGLLHAGMLGIQLARWVGPDHVRSYGVRFTAQVWPGDTLSFAGIVEAVDDDGLAQLALQIVNVDDVVVLRARATATVSPPPAAR